jgi:predicted Zn finger-like uncharacterized protein
MPFTITCPECSATYSVGDDSAGKVGRCKRCQATFSLTPLTRASSSSFGPDPSTDPASSLSPSRRTNGEIPRAVGRYEVVRKLGAGGMGVVYLARDSVLDRAVAIKVPHPSDSTEVRARFLREAKAAARFHHPSFCRILDIGEADGRSFLVMDYIEGQQLRDRIKPGEPWDPREAARVIRELALALAEAHRKGVIHRDLKPANVMISPEGQLILMDFGLARWQDVETSLTPTGAILGTPAYMPPEQAKGELSAIGPRSDIYSLGVIFYELLAGRKPFEGTMTQVLLKIVSADPDPPSHHNPKADPKLSALCLRARAREPEKRPASMDELAKALQAWLEKPSAKSPKPDPRPPEPAPPKWDQHGRNQLPKDEEILKPAPSGQAAKFREMKPVPDPAEAKKPKAWSADRLAGLMFSMVGLALVIAWISMFSSPTKKAVDTIPPPREVPDVPPVRVGDPDAPAPPPAVTSTFPKTVDPESKAEEPLIPTPEPKVSKITPPAPPAYTEKSRFRKQADERIITNSIGMKLVMVPEGSFTIGTPESEPDSRAEERPQREVWITKPYYIGMYEVTQDEYQQVMGVNPSRFGPTGFGKDKLAGVDPARLPVENVEWIDAVNFCNKLNEREGLTPWHGPSGDPLSSPGNGYRLPSEAEWEYACRAGTSTPFAFGDQLTPAEANFDGNFTYNGSAKGVFLERTSPVGSYRANAFGIYDMHGNAWEWCADWYRSDYYATLTERVLDPRGPTSGERRVLRGGCWYYWPRFMRSGDRGGDAPMNRFGLVGFRVVRGR